MKKLFLITLTFLTINSFAQTKNFIDQNYIEVTGKAELEIVPNEIYLKIILNEKDFKGKESLDQMEKAMVDKLQQIGIDISANLAIKDMISNFSDYWIKPAEINSIKIYQLKGMMLPLPVLFFVNLKLLIFRTLPLIGSIIPKSMNLKSR